MSPADPQWNAKAVWGEDSGRWKREPDYMQADLAEDIGDQINALMARNGMTQAQLAERIGSSDAYVSQLLGGASNFQLKTLIKLALALDAHVHVNFDREVELAEAAAERYRRWEAQDEGADVSLGDVPESTAFGFTVETAFARQTAVDAEVDGRVEQGGPLVQ
jgi:transcriptional regulator with XRE-family HTH domain